MSNQYHPATEAMQATCKQIATLKYFCQENGAPLDDTVAALKDACLTLVPHINMSGMVGNTVITEVILADLPDVLAAILEQHDAARYAMPSTTSLEMGRIAHHAISSRNVAALTLIVKKGLVMSFRERPQALTETLIAKDCANRFDLLVAMKDQLPFFADELLDVVSQAGLNIGRAFAAHLKDEDFREIAGQIIGHRSFDALTLKEFAVLVVAGIPLEDHFLLHEMKEVLAPCAMEIVEMSLSNHGRLEIARREPSLAMMLARAPDQPFLDLCSHDNTLVNAAPEY